MIINTVYNEDGEFVREEPFDADIELDKLDSEKQMTEQEYLQTCNTEQLAEFLYDIAYFDNWSDAIMNDSLINETAVEDAIEKWLKQPHREEKHE